MDAFLLTDQLKFPYRPTQRNNHVSTCMDGIKIWTCLPEFDLR